jgi:IclR family pca regulon transcriptional regulator
MNDRNFIRSLERGLAVIRTFSQQHPRQSVAEVAKRAAISRAAARRILLTLEQLGYVGHDGRGDYSLGPAVLSLGYSYLSALEFPDLARPYMEALVADVEHSCSLAVLDQGAAVYVARVPGRQMVNISLTIGSRFPAHLTALGRVLLAGLSDAQLAEHIDNLDLKKWTEYSTVDRKQLLREIERVREQKYSIVGQEMQYGVWAVAAPIRDGRGNTKAAINLAVHDPGMTADKLRAKELPALLRTAAMISGAVGRPASVQI